LKNIYIIFILLD